MGSSKTIRWEKILFSGKDNAKGCTLADFAVDINFPRHGPYQPFDDVQAKAGTGMFSLGRIDLIEKLEDFRQKLRLDTDPGILDDKLHPIVFSLLEPYLHLSSISELSGILDKVSKNVFDFHRVYFDNKIGRREDNIQFYGSLTKCLGKIAL